MPVLLVNLDPLARPVLDACRQPGGDRADVNPRVISFDDCRCVGGVYPAAHPGRGLLTRHPIVFCHGMLACSLLRMQILKNWNYFALLKDFLEDRGFRVLFPMVTPTGGVVERAGRLRDQIVQWTDQPVNVIAHSMGGLDARHMITHLGMADRVRSLTTISTPHRGNYLADWFLENYRRRVPLLLGLEAVGINVDGFRTCQPSVCQSFNATTPDMPGVQYFSYTGAVPQGKVAPMLRRAWALLDQVEGANDGLVSVASAQWNEFLGIIHADHFAQTPDGLFLHEGESFDSVGFFRRVVEDLARRGL